MSILEHKIAKAEREHGPFNSANEIYGVIAEEVYELLVEVHKHGVIYFELIDIATAAMRAAIQIEEEKAEDV